MLRNYSHQSINFFGSCNAIIGSFADIQDVFTNNENDSSTNSSRYFNTVKSNEIDSSSIIDQDAILCFDLSLVMKLDIDPQT